MRIPQFNAESSLTPDEGRYRGLPGSATSGTAGIVPMQGFSAPGRAGSVFQFTKTCCGYAPMLHRYVCTSRAVSPLERCSCVSGLFGPVIVCQPPVATTG